MNIITGKGNNRKVLEFPHASIVNRSPVEQQVAARNMLCGMLNINPDMSEGAAK